MGLTSTALLTTLVVGAVVVPLALALAMWQISRRWLRSTVLIVGVLVCQVLAIAAAGVAANNRYGFYNSWDDVLGKGNAAPQGPVANGWVPKDHSEGTVETLTVPLPARPGASGAGAAMSVMIWLPPQYEQPQYRATKFSVVMILPGQPGTPQGVFRQFNFAAQASQAIARGQVKPFVAVFPPITIAPPRDTECTDVPGGPQALTWLSKNVRQAVLHSVRVTPDAKQWSAMGWSTGGFCAAKLLLRHPDLFHAAVGFGAYYAAETDKGTGDLFRGSQKLRNQNSPIWLIQQPQRGPVRLLIVVSQQDRSSYNGKFYANTKKMIDATRGTPGVDTIVLSKGGHNYHIYRQSLPSALTWLSQNAGL